MFFYVLHTSFLYSSVETIHSDKPGGLRPLSMEFRSASISYTDACSTSVRSTRTEQAYYLAERVIFTMIHEVPAG